MRRSAKNKQKALPAQAIVASLLTLTLSMTLVFAMVINRTQVEKLKMDQLITEKSTKINDVMSRLMYKTQMLSSHVQQNNGEVINFDKMAATIIDDPAILNVLLAPNGVVTNVYPLEGNESVLGLDFFQQGAGNKEAIIAKETGQLVLGGPFDSVQGHQVLVGRLPIYINGPNGGKEFWGLASVTLRYPQALDGAGLNELVIQGFAYEVWRISPDSGAKQIISSSGHHYSRLTHYVEKSLNIANAQWYFRILPVRTWYQFPETWISLIVSLCVSVLVAAVMKNNQELKSLKDNLLQLSNTDALTGIHNRRSFMESAAQQMERIHRTESESYILLYDLDHFKKINDTYGHQAGDEVLKQVSSRVSNMLRAYDLFARYGGEEFIILATDIGRDQVMRLAERVRTEIDSNPIEFEGHSIPVTVSIGVAAAAPSNDLNTAISQSDAALYQAKAAGRNQSVFGGQS